MGKIIWLLKRWLEGRCYHAAHRLTELSCRLSPKAPSAGVAIAPPSHELKYNWRGILESVPAELRKTQAVAVLFGSGQPVEVAGDMVVVEFGYAVHKAIMEMPENQRIAEQVMSNFFGRPMLVSFEMDLLHISQDSGRRP